MLRYLLPAIVALFWASHVDAQYFTGRGTMTLESKGTQSTTLLQSEQVAGRYTPEQKEIRFYIKTYSLAIDQPAATKKMLADCFLADGFPLIEIRIPSIELNGFSNIKLNTGAKVIIAGREADIPLDLTVKNTGEGLLLSGDLDIDFGKLNLQIPAQYQDKMGSVIRFSLDQFPLIQR